MKLFFFLVLQLVFFKCWATDPYPKNEAIDIRHYDFRLEVNDSTNIIYGQASLTIFFKKAVPDFSIDLATNDNSGKGMTVSEVSVSGLKLQYTHVNGKLKINLPSAAKANSTLILKMVYRGEPTDGLIIGTNKYGDRGFFGDNWPDRAHYWLPVIDHPFDKSSVDFTVVAPVHYSVIANGVKMEESFLTEKKKLTHFHEENPIPTKVMVVGIARFAKEVSGRVENIPIESWVYPQNKKEGFFDYSVASRVLEFFNNEIGEYAYKKLANVQSKTRFGGMENANTIFYHENSVTGKGAAEALIAHEIAHQWFGNSITEKDWHHVWLSEGFATYFANLYLEHRYGRDRLAEEQKKDREQIINYFKISAAPVLDTTITDLKKLLSVNSYQKGAWVLHMLRHEVGDENFRKGIRQFYATYKNSNALTTDFRRIMEAASGKDLKVFFQQWIYRGGHPKMEGYWRFDENSKTLSIELSQNQVSGLFNFSLDIRIEGEVKTVLIDRKTHTFTFPLASKPAQIALDPNIWLLFEGGITEK